MIGLLEKCTAFIPRLKSGLSGCFIRKGNKDFNFSAPHGAGRLFGRNAMKTQLKSNPGIMNEFERRMTNVFSSCIDKNTIDESPMAYKPLSMIEAHLKETIDIENIVRPIYNLKG
jgi:RNA-splicing ligase RtcB